MASEPAVAEMGRAYDPHEAEAAMYALWERGGYFAPEAGLVRAGSGGAGERSEPFCMIMPPPNVNGELHMGHALMLAIEDVVTRWHRMRGEPTLWLPGTDHAGIATQLAVERELALEGISRQDLGREEFVERVWRYVDRVRDGIYRQTIHMGASCDWSRRRFTMDDVPQLAVRTTFKRLYDDGLIYRGTRIINWCPRCATALSDLEVDYQEEQGSLYTIKYPVIDAEGAETGQYVEMATTRPETIVGDTAVAVNPDDPRYTALHGARLRLPIIGREIPLVTDAAVEMAFGTGAVKVTPGHDPTDWEIGQRHDLPVVNVMNPDATMNENAGPYAGYDRTDARKRIVADFEAIGLLVKVEPYTHSVGHCDRCDTVVEPLVSPQWYVKMEPLAKPAIEAVTSGRIRIIPERYTKVYLNWMENIRDWCISRQLWWGHRIPVWYCDGCGAEIVAIDTPAACPKCGASAPRQDEDVLDTWFSSGLWPFSTLGWPHDSDDLRRFYPTTLMETGWDILFFWVARMIVLGLYNMGGEVPFRDVYLHGMVRDERGRKMSKTKGNGVDPLLLIDRYGADAVRFALVVNTTPGNDLKWSDEKVERARNFCNKLWNAVRFVLGRLEGRTPPSIDSLDRAALPLEDRWLLSRLNTVAADANQLFAEYNFAEAGRRLDDFVWDEFCDWYIEAAKVRLQAGDDTPLPVLAYAIEVVLRLLHPFVPFVTEAIWQSSRGQLPGEAAEALIVAGYPRSEPGWHDDAAEAAMLALIDAVRAVRNIRTERKLGTRPHEVYVEVADGTLRAALQEREAIFATLSRARPLHIVARGDAPAQGVARAVLDAATVVVPLAGEADRGEMHARLLKELQGAEAQVERLKKQLANEAFLAKAPAQVVEKLRADLATAEARVAELRRALDELG